MSWEDEYERLPQSRGERVGDWVAGVVDRSLHALQRWWRRGVDCLCDELWLEGSIFAAVIMALVGALFLPWMLLMLVLRGSSMVQRIENEKNHELYLRRVFLTPRTKIGGLYFHIFHRGDQDRDPHDHPWAFVTFPFQSYWEKVFRDDGSYVLNRVKGWRLHHRPAAYRHRVIGREYIEVRGDYVQKPGDKKLYTLVWHGVGVNSWGFWVPAYDHRYWGRFCDSNMVGGRLKVHWREYLDG